jgi:patatin-like phospholipase/acyl hydrolase
MGTSFKILSIDGGGIRGVYPAHILRCIEERIQINLFDTFDMISGTSTGSIIAAGIATGISASDILEMYIDHGSNIFRSKRFFLPLKNIRKMIQPMFSSIYNVEYLKKTLTDVFGDIRMGDIKKPLLIPATDIGNGSVHVFKSGYSDDFTRDVRVMVKDAVLASCSAPTYFDPHRINDYLIADGGLWANNPTLVAVIDAIKRLLIAQENIKIFSIGTGNSKSIYGTNVSRNWGLINGWRHKEFISFILSLQSQSALNYVNLLFKPKQIMRIDFETDNPLPMDDISVIDDLISRADHNFTHESEGIQNFLNGGN